MSLLPVKGCVVSCQERSDFPSVRERPAQCSLIKYWCCQPLIVVHHEHAGPKELLANLEVTWLGAAVGTGLGQTCPELIDCP